MDKNAVIVEGLRTLLDAREALLLHARQARQTAEDALGDASKALEIAEKEVAEVRRVLDAVILECGVEERAAVSIQQSMEGPLSRLASLKSTNGLVSRAGNLYYHRREPSTGRLVSMEPSSGPRRGREWKDAVADQLVKLLSDGQRKPAMELHVRLVRAGYSFAGIANPLHRIVQIMSADSRFEANRAEGWGLAKQIGDDSSQPNLSEEGGTADRG